MTPIQKPYQVVFLREKSGEWDEVDTFDFATEAEALNLLDRINGLEDKAIGREYLGDVYLTPAQRDAYNRASAVQVEHIERNAAGELESDCLRGIDIASKEIDLDDEWRREIAMEEGMLGGCDAYNEVMGYR